MDEVGRGYDSVEMEAWRGWEDGRGYDSVEMEAWRGWEDVIIS